MTTPDPSREAFEKWADDVFYDGACTISEDWSIERNLYKTASHHMAFHAWQAAMAHKGAELQQAHEARRQAQTELATMQEKRNRIGLDIDLALRGEVNEQSPIAGRLKLIAEANRWQPIETAPKDGTVVLLAHPKGRIADGCHHPRYGAWSWPYVMSEPTHWAPLPAAPKQEGST